MGIRILKVILNTNLREIRESLIMNAIRLLLEIKGVNNCTGNFWNHMWRSAIILLQRQPTMY